MLLTKFPLPICSVGTSCTYQKPLYALYFLYYSRSA